LFNASDIFNTALGAFIGLFLSMFLENRLSRRRRKKCIVNIALELNDIKNLIKNHLNDSTPTLSYAIYTPIWETVIGNGDILELKNEAYYDDIFLVYGQISKLSKMEDFAKENSITNITTIKQQRAFIIKLLSSKTNFQNDTEFKEHKLYTLLEKYANRQGKEGIL
jgi:hypothetical protein